MLVMAAALAGLGPATDVPELRHLSHSKMSSVLRECGLRHSTIFYDDSLQSDVAKIDDTQVTDAQLVCAFRAQDRTVYILEWEASVVARYYDISAALWRPRILANARAYFADRPELGALPRREPGDSDLHYARELGWFCGPGAAGIAANQFGRLVVSPDWMMGRDFEAVSRDLGFIGNEKTTDED